MLVGRHSLNGEAKVFQRRSAPAKEDEAAAQ